MPKQLSQDLPAEMDITDILWGDTPEETPEEVTEPSTEIPEEAPEKTPEEITEGITKDTTEETPEEWTPKEEGEETPEEESTEIDQTLEDILGDNKEIKEEIDDANKQTEEIKGTIEEAKWAIDDEDIDEAGKLIDDLYAQVVDYSTKVDTLSTKNEILQSKLMDLTKSNTEYELQLAQSSWKSSDPKMLILNRMYDWALSWEEFSKEKVISTLEDMYYGLTGKTFEEKRIDKVSDENAGEISLNNVTPPVVEEDTPEEIDLNSMSSIF